MQRPESYTGVTLGGRYVLGEMLGKGGFGAVYKAVQSDLGRNVAVKILHADAVLAGDGLARFAREARAAAALGHPNIAQVSDFQIRDGEPPFIVLEYLEGQTLGALLRKKSRLEPGRVCAIAHQVLSALDVAHRAGITHRDVKPDNIFLVALPGLDDFVKLLDFGIAKLSSATTALTDFGTMLGTPAFMAPEQVANVLDAVCGAAARTAGTVEGSRWRVDARRWSARAHRGGRRRRDRSLRSPRRDRCVSGVVAVVAVELRTDPRECRRDRNGTGRDRCAADRARRSTGHRAARWCRAFSGDTGRSAADRGCRHRARADRTRRDAAAGDPAGSGAAGRDSAWCCPAGQSTNGRALRDARDRRLHLRSRGVPVCDRQGDAFGAGVLRVDGVRSPEPRDSRLFDLTKNGNVTDVRRNKSSGAAHAKLDGCVGSAIRRAKYPPSPGNTRVEVFFRARL